jgi:hypothetical protein
VSCGAPTVVPAPHHGAPLVGVGGHAAGPPHGAVPPPVPGPAPLPRPVAVPPGPPPAAERRPRSTVFLVLGAVLLLVLGGGAGFALGRSTAGSARLAAPELLGPPGGAVFDYYPRDLDLTWAPVDGATGYTVDIQYANRPGGSVRDWRPEPGEGTTPGITATTFHFSFVGAQPGRWRVTALGPDGAVGPPSPWSEFTFLR